MRRFFSLLLNLCLLGATQTSARAQAEAYAEITSIEARTFPQVTVLVDVFNSSGEFISGLDPDLITVYEDSQPLPVDALAETLSDAARNASGVPPRRPLPAALRRADPRLPARCTGRPRPAGQRPSLGAQQL